MDLLTLSAAQEYTEEKIKEAGGMTSEGIAEKVTEVINEGNIIDSRVNELLNDNAKRVVPFAIGISIAQNKGETYDTVLTQLNKVIEQKYDEVTITLHEYCDEDGSTTYDLTTSQVKSLVDYANEKGIDVNLKIHVKDARTLQENGTLNVSTWETNHKAYVTDLASKSMVVKRVYDFNETMAFCEHEEFKDFIISCINILKGLTKAGISFSEYAGCDRCIDEIKQNLDIIGINHYPYVCSSENAKGITIEQIQENVSFLNQLEWYKAMQKKYDCEFTITECGCPYYWECYEYSAMTNFDGFTYGGGEVTEKYLRAILLIFKDLPIKSFAFWYFVSCDTDEVKGLVKYMKGLV